MIIVALKSVFKSMNRAAEPAPSPAEALGAPRAEEFDLFISYATAPDYPLARELERFLSRFHQFPGIQQHGLAPLRVCVDGSSFLQRRRGEVRTVDQVVRDHLERSRQLLVLCSTGAVRSAAVAAEAQSFLARGQAGAIHLAVSEGEDPAAHPRAVFPAPILAAGLERAIWFDLRGFRGRAARGWTNVRDFRREQVRLAAEVLAAVGKSRDLTAAELYPEWLEAERRAAGRRARRAWAVAAAMVVLALAATALGLVAEVQRRRVALLRDLSEVRRAAAEARAVVDLEPERGLRGSAAAWQALQRLEPRAQATPAVRTELARARAEALQSMFATLASHPGFVGSLGGPRSEPLLAASRDGGLLVVADGAVPATRLELWTRRADGVALRGRLELPGRGRCLAVDDQGRHLLAASRRFIRLWDLDASGAAGAPRTVDVAATPYAELSCSSAVLDPLHGRAWLGTNEGELFALELPGGRLTAWPGGRLGGIVNDLAVNPRDGRLFAAAWTASASLTSVVPDATGRAPVQYLGVALPARALALSADGLHLFSGHEDGTVALWDAASGRLLTADRLSASSIVEIVVQPGDRELVAGNEEGELIAVRVGKVLEVRARSRLFRGPVTALVRGREGSVVGASPLASVREWRADAPRPLETVLAAPTGAALGLAFDPLSGELAAFGPEEIQRWRRADGVLAAVPVAAPAIPAGFRIGAAARGGRLLALVPAYGSGDRRLRLSSPALPAPALLSGFVAPLVRLAFSPTGRRLAAAAFERPLRIAVWSADAPAAPPKVLSDPRGGAISQLAFSPDERRVAASDLTHCARVWTIDGGRAEPPVCDADDAPGPAAWNPRTGELAVGWLPSGKISIQQVAAGGGRRLLEHHRVSISALKFDPAGRWLVSASSDGMLLWWDTATWSVIGETHEPGGSFVRDLAVSPDGTSLATLDQGGTRLSVWPLDADKWARRAMRLGGAPATGRSYR
jgi:WD40 repeat protein